MVIDERIAERRAEVRDIRRRSRLRRTIAAVSVAIVVAALVAIERSPLVGLEEVRVVGTDRLTDDEVRRAADLELGTSTLRLGLRDATARVAALPLVRTASASRLDPLTVQIEVVERRPAINVTGGGRSRLVDREGVIIADDRLEALPEIELGDAPPSVGDDVGGDPALDNAHRAWLGLSGPLRAEVARFEAAGPDELVLHLDRGIEVRFGRAQRIDEKVRALGAILDDLEAEGAAADDVGTIDVRAPSAPVVVGR